MGVVEEYSHRVMNLKALVRMYEQLANDRDLPPSRDRIEIKTDQGASEYIDHPNDETLRAISQARSIIAGAISKVVSVDRIWEFD